MNHPKEFAEGLSIGIIMDGNGRWAKQRGLPRTAGHKKGAAVFQDIANYCEELGVSSASICSRASTIRTATSASSSWATGPRWMQSSRS